MSFLLKNDPYFSSHKPLQTTRQSIGYAKPDHSLCFLLRTAGVRPGVRRGRPCGLDDFTLTRRKKAGGAPSGVTERYTGHEPCRRLQSKRGVNTSNGTPPKKMADMTTFVSSTTRIRLFLSPLPPAARRVLHVWRRLCRLDACLPLSPLHGTRVQAR